jgi:hypothetical protein
MISDRGPFHRKGVEAYIAQMAKPRDGSIYDSTVTAMLEKAGYNIPEDPASIYDPEQLFETLDCYDVKDEFTEDEFISRAIGRAYRVFGKRGDEVLERVVQPEELKEGIDLSTSAGVYFDTKLGAWERAQTRMEKVLAGKAAPHPCLAGARTQRGNKTRLVWMYPLEMVMIESSFGRPLIEKFKVIRTPMPYGLRRHELGARLHSTLTERNVVALDFSKFDSTVPAKLIKVAFRILKTWFDMDEEDVEAWYLIERYFLSAPIVMPDGHLYVGKRKGVPSGSVFTQLVDSIINYIIITAAQLKFNLHPHEKRVHVLGDDSVFSTNEDVNLSQLKLYFGEMGFNLSVRKSEVSKPENGFHFLGFDWLKGVPTRDPELALKSLTQPEKWRQRMEERRNEHARALRLILEMATLGTNLYEVLWRVSTVHPNQHIYLEPESWATKASGLTGFMQYQRRELCLKKQYWRNVASGVFI